MTDRIHSITVVLEENIRVDDAEQILNAMRQFRGVVHVEGNVADSTTVMAESRAKSELYGQFLKMVKL